MYYWRILNGLISRWLESLRGTRTVTDTTARLSQIESLVAYAVADYTVTLHCKERKYTCAYGPWYAPKRVMATYEVFTTVTGKPPQVLVEACANDKTFPALLHYGASSKNQKEAAIEAYIDLVQAYLEATPDRMSQPMKLL